MDGYDCPVYSTEYCPKNETEWKEMYKAINCTDKNGYVCLPKDNITELLEFCYILFVEHRPHFFTRKSKIQSGLTSLI